MLKWTFRGGYDGHEWNASETEKWYYSIALKCDETATCLSWPTECPLTTAWHTRTTAISNKNALRSKKLSAPSGNGTLSVTQTMTPSLTNMEATLLHGSNLRPRNGLGLEPHLRETRQSLRILGPTGPHWPLLNRVPGVKSCVLGRRTQTGDTLKVFFPASHSRSISC